MTATQSLVQYRSHGSRGMALLRGGQATTIPSATSTLDLAHRALRKGTTLAALAESMGKALDLAAVELLAPIDQPDTAHLLLTGTGLVRAL